MNWPNCACGQPCKAQPNGKPFGKCRKSCQGQQVTTWPNCACGQPCNAQANGQPFGKCSKSCSGQKSSQKVLNCPFYIWIQQSFKPLTRQEAIDCGL